MKAAAVLLLCTAIATPAFAETVGEKTGVNSTLGIAPTTADFVHEAVISDMFEIGSSKLALTRTTGPTKQFAEKMIKDHSKTTDQLKAAALKAKVDVPAKMDEAHEKMLTKLQGINGSDFATEYHRDQEDGHKDAVSLFTRYANGGDNPELKAWATKTLPDLQGHLKMAQDLDK